MKNSGLMIFSGSASKKLTQKICDYLNTKPCKNEVINFSEGSTFVRVLENVRGRDVYIIQSIVYKANDYFMELLFWIDAFKRASASSVTVVIPFLSYGKGDKKDEPRVSLRARVCADALETAGADRVIAMDLHSPQIQGFFKIPVDNLYGYPTLCNRIRELVSEDFIIVAPDTGFADEARTFADHLGAGVAIGDKHRSAHDEKAEILDIIGNVENKTAIVVDDFVISGGTLAGIAKRLVKRGARRILTAVTHGAFSPGSMEKIENSPIEKLLITDTIENQPIEFSSKIEIVSVADYFAEAIKRIHNHESISEMFP
jgi:ribose-phosphate pyrophosphokinase